MSVLLAFALAVSVVFFAAPARAAAPESPALVAPGDTGTDISTSPTLEVTVSDTDGDPMDVTFYGRPANEPLPGPDFTIIAMPDTQHYTDNPAHEANFAAQTSWITANKDALNIAFVTGLGDIVQNGNDNDSEWQIASAAYALIEDPLTTLLDDGIPFGLAAGNHDQTPTGFGSDASTAKYNQYFGITRFAGRSYNGGYFGSDYDNHYELFSAGGMDFMAFHFEYDTSMETAVLDWAQTAIDANPGRRVMISTHYMINGGNPATFGTQGQAIYNALSDNENLFLMLGGHIHAEGQREDTGSNGNVIHSLLSDYQDLDHGGDGWLRIMEFSPANDEITVSTYSPVLDDFGNDTTMGDDTTSAPFVLDYEMLGDPWVEIGTDTGVASGTTASIEWSDLDGLTEYEWYAVADDGADTTQSSTWTFTTENGPPPATTGTVDIQVSHQSDDAEEQITASTGGAVGEVVINSSDLEMVNDAGDGGFDQLVGMRFQNVTIPVGATVLSSYIEFVADPTNSPGANLMIFGEADPNPLAYSTADNNISTRPLTTASAGWNPEAWVDNGETHRTTSLAAVVQEIVDLGGWSPGQAMAFVVDGTSGGRVRAESYDGLNAGASAPRLVVEWALADGLSAAVFQQGVGGYSGTVDTFLDATATPTDHRDDDNSAADELIVDLVTENHTLLRFEDVFGSGSGQVPSGSTIESATLQVQVSNEGHGAYLHRMISLWDDGDSWNTWVDGIQADGVEAEAASNANSPATDVGPATVDVTADVQAWSDGVAENRGWAFLPPATDNSWRFDSAEYVQPAILTIAYTDSTDPTIFVSGTPLVPFSSEPGVASDEQSYSVTGSNLTGDIAIAAPADFEVSLSSGSGFDSSVTLTESGGLVALTEVFVRMLSVSEGTPSGDIAHTSAGAASVVVPVSGTVLAVPDEWVAYNDMNTLGGDTNYVNVTEFEYAESGSLVDLATGAVLPVTVTGSTSDTLARYDDGGPVTNADSDAYAVFDAVADLMGTDQLQAGESASLTFADLDHTKKYAITLSANRAEPEYAGQRYAQVSIAGTDAATAASSAGVVENPDGSVSFSIGDNSENGYVARWIEIDPGIDGEFTITTEWDESFPGTRGYAMAAFRLETYDVVDVTDPVVVVSTPADGATYYQGEVVTVDYACGDLESGIASCDGDAEGVPALDGSTLDTSTLGSGFEFTVTAWNGAGLMSVVTHSYDVVEAPTTVEVRVTHDDDDAEEYLEGGNEGFVDLDSSDLEFVRDLDTADVGDQMVGMRFQNVVVPQGATITAAHLEFTVDELDSIDPTVLWISGEDIDDALRFAETSENITSRAQTAADSLWVPDDWTAIGTTHQSSDISRVVQEIVDRGGWASGNAMALFVSGEGQRIAEAHDSGSATAPLLHVEYVTEPVPLAASFQQGVGSYVGTVDTYLDDEDGNEDDDNSTDDTLIVDLVSENHILLRFDGIFGSGPGQVPAGSTIEAATLEVNVTNSGDGALLHRMLQPWKIDAGQVDSWNSWVNGIQADGVEAEVVSQSSTPGGLVKASAIDVTADLQAWADGATNHGWAFLPPATDDSWRFDSAEGTTPPILTIEYSPPPPSSASLVLSGDNVMDVFVNGLLVGSSSNWMEATSLAADVAAGDVVGVHVTDLDWSGGLLAQIEWDGSTFVSDTSWMVTASTPAAGWNDRGFDDSGWDAATSYGSWGAAPWMDWMSGFPSPTSAQWIWTDQNDNTGDDDVYFRWVVGTPSAADDTIVASADNAMDLYVNGSLVASSVDWMSATKVFDSLSDGDVIGVHATDSPGGWFGGFIGQIDWDGQTAVSDSSWKVTSSVPASDWADQGFNDSGWDDATAYGPLGVSPWMDWMSGFPAPSSAQWIWSADNINDDDVYFRKVLGTPSASSDSIVASADNEMDLYVNGLLVGSSSDWLSATSVFADLSVGDVVAVAARDFTGLGDGDVAGFIAQVEWDGNTAVSDASWKVTAATPASDWADQGFDDSGWDAASSYGPLGGAPWMDWMTGFPSPTTAQWIWSADNTGDDSVWLRFEIPSGP